MLPNPTVQNAPADSPATLQRHEPPHAAQSWRTLDVGDELEEHDGWQPIRRRRADEPCSVAGCDPLASRKVV